MQLTDCHLPTVNHESTASTGYDGLDHDAKPATAAPTISSTAIASESGCSPFASDDSPRISVWLVDGGLDADRQRTLHDVQQAADHALEAAGACDMLGLTAFAADDGRIYSVRVVALVEEADPVVARALIEDALAACAVSDDARRMVLESHLRHLAVR